MNINNFEKHINRKILDRGYDYYIEGNIVETYKQGENEYIFKVQGSEDYEVIVKIDSNGEILNSKCDCPYDFSPICKHQVAAYFELFEILNCEKHKEIAKKEVVKQPEIKEVLNTLPKEELINIIIDFTHKDIALKNSIIFKYSKGDGTQEIEKCNKLIDSIVRKYTGREGFITYRETYAFVNEMEGLLDNVRDTDDLLLALDIAFLVLDESIQAFQYADDSNGEIGDLVTKTIELIGEIASDSDDLDISLREKIFNKLLMHSDSKVFEGWEDFTIDLLRVCAQFANVEVFRKKLRMKIEYLVNTKSSDDYMKYNTERMLKILFDLIEKYDTKEEAEQFIKDNLIFSSFREAYINMYIKEKNYHKVIELAIEGEKQDKQYVGLVSKWKNIRYTAYKALSLKEEQEKLAKELLFAGDFQFYKELRELVAGDKEVFYTNLKQELKNEKSWHGRSIYLKLIVEEKDLDEIIEFVRQNLGYIEDYAKMLVDKFQDEVIEIYKKYIKSVADSSSKRKDYQNVCEVLRRYKKIAGKKNQEEMVRELCVLYKRRPAFIDELNKIK